MLIAASLRLADVREIKQGSDGILTCCKCHDRSFSGARGSRAASWNCFLRKYISATLPHMTRRRAPSMQNLTLHVKSEFIWLKVATRLHAPRLCPYTLLLPAARVCQQFHDKWGQLDKRYFTCAACRMHMPGQGQVFSCLGILANRTKLRPGM